MGGKKQPLNIISVGHGGKINGVIQTKGKRSPDWEKGVYYEGIGNRDFAHNVCRELNFDGLPTIAPFQADWDFPINFKANIINQYTINYDVIAIEIHSDAFQINKGNGISAFTTKGNTKSDKLASLFINEAKLILPKEKFRTDYSDGDSDKEANFTILKKTHCPITLLELLFMTHRSDYYKLFDTNYRKKLVLSMVNAIRVYRGYSRKTKLDYYESTRGF